MKKKKKIKENSKKNKNTLLIFVIVVLVISLVNFIFIFRGLPLEIKRIEVDFAIGEQLGVDLDNETLTFGIVVPGYSIQRNVNIKNNYDVPINVKVDFSKNIERFLSVSEDNFLDVGENKDISINLKIPKDEKFGNYSGTAIFKISEVKG